MMFVFKLFVVDKVDIGLLDIVDATGRQRLNDTIAQFSNDIQQGLTGTVHNFRFGVTSLRRCAFSEGINDGCSGGTVVKEGCPDYSRSTTFISKMGTFMCIQYWLFAVAALYIIRT